MDKNTKLIIAVSTCFMLVFNALLGFHCGRQFQAQSDLIQMEKIKDMVTNQSTRMNVLANLAEKTSKAVQEATEYSDMRNKVSNDLIEAYSRENRKLREEIKQLKGEQDGVGKN